MNCTNRIQLVQDGGMVTEPKEITVSVSQRSFIALPLFTVYSFLTISYVNNFKINLYTDVTHVYYSFPCNKTDYVNC